MKKSARISLNNLDNVDALQTVINDMTKTLKMGITLLLVIGIIVTFIGMFIPGFCLFGIAAFFVMSVKFKRLKKRALAWQEELRNIVSNIFIRDKELKDLENMIEYKTKQLIELEKQLTTLKNPHIAKDNETSKEISESQNIQLAIDTEEDYI